MRAASSGPVKRHGSPRGGCTGAVAEKSRSGCCATRSWWSATAAAAKVGSSCSGRLGVTELKGVRCWVLGVRRSEEHTYELQSLTNLVCRLLLEKKKLRTMTL